MEDEQRRYPGDEAYLTNSEDLKAESAAKIEILETKEANGTLTDAEFDELELLRSSENLLE